jgi:hypothetical protein
MRAPNPALRFNAVAAGEAALRCASTVISVSYPTRLVSA